MKSKALPILLSAISIALVSGSYLRAHASTSARSPSTHIHWEGQGPTQPTFTVTFCTGGIPSGQTQRNVGYVQALDSGLLRYETGGANTSMQVLGEAWCGSSPTPGSGSGSWKWAGGGSNPDASNLWVNVDQGGWFTLTNCTGSRPYAQFSNCVVADLY